MGRLKALAQAATGEQAPSGAGVQGLVFAWDKGLGEAQGAHQPEFPFIRRAAEQFL